MNGHVGPNDNIQGTQTDIRPAPEVAAWRERDPIPRLERTLLAEGRVPAEVLEKIRASAATEVQEAHAWAQQSPRPPADDIERYLFHA